MVAVAKPKPKGRDRDGTESLGIDAQGGIAGLRAAGSPFP